MSDNVIYQIDNVSYTHKRIVYKKRKTSKTNIEIPYDEIISFYFKTCLSPWYMSRYVHFDKYLVINTIKGKYKICIEKQVSFVLLDEDLENNHISILTHMAPQAKYLKKEKLSRKIKNKLYQVNTFLKSDD